LQTGLDATKKSGMLMRWYRQCRITRSFNVPKEAKKNLPPILELNSNVTNAIKKYALENGISVYSLPDNSKFDAREKRKKCKRYKKWQ
jgi:hypothetical protein